MKQENEANFHVGNNKDYLRLVLLSSSYCYCGTSKYNQVAERLE